MELWHCTRLEYLDGILQHGIIAQVPLGREYKTKGVYLSEYQFNWMWNTTREGKAKGACIKIDVEGLKLIDDYHLEKIDLLNNSKCIGKDFICLSDIEPERIREVLVETEPNTFSRLVFPMVKGAK